MFAAAIFGEHEGVVVECCGESVSIYRAGKRSEHMTFDAIDLPVSNTEQLIEFCAADGSLPAALIINTLKRDW